MKWNVGRRDFLRRASLSGAVLSSGTGLAGATTVRPELSYGETVEGEIEDSDTHAPEEGEGSGFFAEPYNFVGEEGDEIEITMRSSEINPWMRVVGPDGYEVIEGNRREGETTLQTTLETSGTYTIWAQTYRTYSYGGYELSLGLVGDSEPAETEEDTPVPTARPATETPEKRMKTATAIFGR